MTVNHTSQRDNAKHNIKYSFQDDTPPDVDDDDGPIETTTVLSSHTTTSSSSSSLSHHGTRLGGDLTRDHPELSADVVTDEI